MEEGTDSAADPALLLNVMEVNEKLAETQSLDEVNAVGQEVQGVHRYTAFLCLFFFKNSTHLYTHM